MPRYRTKVFFSLVQIALDEDQSKMATVSKVNRTSILSPKHYIAGGSSQKLMGQLLTFSSPHWSRRPWGLFKNHVDKSLPIFDHHLPHVDKHENFLNYLPISTWTFIDPPNSSICTLKFRFQSASYKETLNLFLNLTL